MKCFCGKSAVTLNSEGVPCCSEHKSKKINPPVCPECGLKRIIRKGKYGFFWGCVAFPSCNGVRKI